ncbi:hypothetical protein JTE90_005569 [Oedothorax gibbosus]|uniref:Laminin G domain-containing protein n=1 Tax=Oedothorax gibbosus TaxID=931172 RepID=A0AAV6V9V8_9ARAC|nr:hypothetical protein JTE90_005569 [Oedothorax gibbosus]
MKLFSCRYQRTIEATAVSACPKVSKKKHSKIPLFLKRSAKKKDIWMQRQLNNFTVSTRSKRDKYNSDWRDITPVFPRNITVMTNSNAIKNIFVDIKFVTHNANGVIFYFGKGHENDTMYLLMLIRNSYLELRIKNIDETRIFNSKYRIIKGKSYLVSLKYFPRFVVLYINRKSTGMIHINEHVIPSKSKLKIFLGSVPKHLRRKRKYGHELSRFVGCFSTLNMSLNFSPTVEIDSFYMTNKDKLFSCGGLRVSVKTNNSRSKWFIVSIDNKEHDYDIHKGGWKKKANSRSPSRLNTIKKSDSYDSFENKRRIIIDDYDGEISIINDNTTVELIIE